MISTVILKDCITVNLSYPEQLDFRFIKNNNIPFIAFTCNQEIDSMKRIQKQKYIMTDLIKREISIGAKLIYLVKILLLDWNSRSEILYKT